MDPWKRGRGTSRCRAGSGILGQGAGLHGCMGDQEGRYQATWKRELKLPWRKDGLLKASRRFSGFGPLGCQSRTLSLNRCLGAWVGHEGDSPPGPCIPQPRNPQLLSLASAFAHLLAREWWCITRDHITIQCAEVPIPMPGAKGFPRRGPHIGLVVHTCQTPGCQVMSTRCGGQ